MKDPQDGYSFVYPFGWQEVAVKGQDIVYKDVIEPLESVSVSITQTDKADVTEFGSPAEVRLRAYSYLTDCKLTQVCLDASCVCSPGPSPCSLLPMSLQSFALLDAGA